MFFVDFYQLRHFVMLIIRHLNLISVQSWTYLSLISIWNAGSIETSISPWIQYFNVGKITVSNITGSSDHINRVINPKGLYRLG